MTNYIITKVAFLFRAPDPGADRLGRVEVGTRFQGRPVPGGFIETRIESISSEMGYVGLLEHATEEPVFAESIAPEDVEAFCRMVTKAARDHAADRDYLMAVAYSGTNNLAELGAVGAKQIGPFQFTEEEWHAAITTGAAKGLHFLPEDRFLWYQQPAVAALLAAEWAMKLQARSALGRAPVFAELYFAQLFGVGAETLLKRPRTEGCKAAMATLQLAPAAGTYGAKLAASDTTIGDALAVLRTRLITGYAEALKVIDQQPLEIRIFRPDHTLPPWLEIARDEMSRGVAEIPGARDNDQIRQYHAITGVTDQHDETAWCGSFMTYCMKKSGAEAVQHSVVTPDSAKASWWKNWGKEADHPLRIGTVVVLRPQAKNSSGHVGILVEGSNETTVQLLAGNQGGTDGQPDHVSVVSFNVKEVVARRWLDVAPVPSAAGSLATSALERQGIKVEATDALFMDKAPCVMRNLITEFPDLTIEQAAAILGNIGHECMGFHVLHQKDMLPGRGGHGWCQWDGTRREDFLAWARNKDLDWQSDEANFSFLVHELKTSEAPAFNATKRQRTLEGAVIEFDREFERSGKKNLPSRFRYAGLALEAYRQMSATA